MGTSFSAPTGNRMSSHADASGNSWEAGKGQCLEAVRATNAIIIKRIQVLVLVPGSVPFPVPPPPASLRAASAACQRPRLPVNRRTAR